MVDLIDVISGKRMSETPSVFPGPLKKHGKKKIHSEKHDSTESSVWKSP